MVFADTMADLNVKQLEEGKRYDGKNIIPKYATNEYATFKKAIGAKPAKFTPDLKVTGEFHSSIYPVQKKDVIIMDATDEKKFKLEKKYDKILGLTKQSKADMKPDVLDELLKRTRDELFKD
jgi:hypothetical protein